MLDDGIVNGPNLASPSPSLWPVAIAATDEDPSFSASSLDDIFKAVEAAAISDIDVALLLLVLVAVASIVLVVLATVLKQKR